MELRPEVDIGMGHVQRRRHIEECLERIAFLRRNRAPGIAFHVLVGEQCLQRMAVDRHRPTVGIADDPQQLGAFHAIGRALVVEVRSPVLFHAVPVRPGGIVPHILGKARDMAEPHIDRRAGRLGRPQHGQILIDIDQWHRRRGDGRQVLTAGALGRVWPRIGARHLEHFLRRFQLGAATFFSATFPLASATGSLRGGPHARSPTLPQALAHASHLCIALALPFLTITGFRAIAPGAADAARVGFFVVVTTAAALPVALPLTIRAGIITTHSPGFALGPQQLFLERPDQSRNHLPGVFLIGFVEPHAGLRQHLAQLGIDAFDRLHQVSLGPDAEFIVTAQLLIKALAQPFFHPFDVRLDLFDHRRQHVRRQLEFCRIEFLQQFGQPHRLTRLERRQLLSVAMPVILIDQ